MAQRSCMVLDDSLVVRKAARRIIEGFGFTVREAKDGQEALSACRESLPDGVLLDWNMPVMDGITFVTELKKLPEHRFTPVIMLTTEAGDSMKQRGQAAGAKAWVVKPFQPAQMLTAVTKLVMP